MRGAAVRQRDHGLTVLAQTVAQATYLKIAEERLAGLRLRLCNAAREKATD